VQVGPLNPSTFLQAATAEYGSESASGWNIIIPPYMIDLSTALFTPRASAAPPPAPPTVSPPLQGSASQLYSSLLGAGVDPVVAAKFTNALFIGIFDDIIAAGPALPVKPVVVSPYAPV
jgi:hypothetical protein